MSDHWQAAGNCHPADARLFDPVGKADQADGGRARFEVARAICQGCPVLDNCYQEAIRDKDSGVRAGFYFVHGRPMKNPPRKGRPKIDRLKDAA